MSGRYQKVVTKKLVIQPRLPSNTVVLKILYKIQLNIPTSPFVLDSPTESFKVCPSLDLIEYFICANVMDPLTITLASLLSLKRNRSLIAKEFTMQKNLPCNA